MYLISKRLIVSDSMTSSWKNIKCNRFTNIFLIKSHMNLFCAKARPVYLWQNQAWLKDEVIHSCQVIIYINNMTPKSVSAVISLSTCQKDCREGTENQKFCSCTNKTTPKWYESGKNQNYWFWGILICQFQPWPNPVFNEKWRTQKQS